MAVKLQRGATCRICFYPKGGLNVATLGEPSIVLMQNDTLVAPAEVVKDVSKNRIYADLSESDTIQLVEGLVTKAQATFIDEENQKVLKFPVHDVIVEMPLVDSLYFESEDDNSYEAPVVYMEIDVQSNQYEGANPSELGLYEFDGSDYVPTEDQELSEGKKYFVKE